MAVKYTTVAAVRRRAGFQNNFSITTASIESTIEQAESVIDGIVARRYSLPLASTPKMVESCAEFLSTGYLLLEEYGVQSQGSDKDGTKWVNHVLGIYDDKGRTLMTGLLTLLEQGKSILVDSSGVEYARSNVMQPEFYPNDASKNDLLNPTAPKFGMNDEY